MPVLLPNFFPDCRTTQLARRPSPRPGTVHCPKAGADAIGILEGIEQGKIKALYLAGANPLVAFPENARWRKALDKLDILVVQDILASDLTALATVVLPGAASSEKRGSVTAMDQRVNKLRIAVAAPGEARPDLAILSDLFARLTGKPEPSENAIRQEMMELSGGYTDVCQALEQSNFCWKQPYSPAKPGSGRGNARTGRS